MRTWTLRLFFLITAFTTASAARAVESIERVVPRKKTLPHWYLPSPPSAVPSAAASPPLARSAPFHANPGEGLGYARTAQRRLAQNSGRHPTAEPQTRVTRSLSNLPSEEKIETNAQDIAIEEQTGTGFAIFLGAGGGYFDISNSFRTGSHGRSGPSLMGQINFAVINERFLIEIGAGWIWSTVSGAGATTSGGTTTFSESNVTTRAGFIEFSPRLRIGKYWDIGPQASVLIGTDSAFSTAVGDSTPPVFVGAKTSLMFETKSLLFRIVASGGISLTIPDRRVIYGMAALEMGIPIIRGKTIVRERETKVVRDHHERETIERETTLLREVEVPLLLMTFDDQIIHFEFDRAELKTESKQFLQALGRFLVDADADWDRLKIEGHTDLVGSADYNQKLSDARAAAVRQTLQQSGVPAYRMASLGLGKTRPIDPQATDLARARNRRVELSFSGVRDAQRLRDGVNRLKLAYTTPTTCQGGVCR